MVTRSKPWAAGMADRFGLQGAGPREIELGYVPIYLRSKFTGATHILMAVFAGTFTIE